MPQEDHNNSERGAFRERRDWRLDRIEDDLKGLQSSVSSRREANDASFAEIRKTQGDQSSKLASIELQLTWLTRGVWAVLLMILMAVVAAMMRNVIVQDAPGRSRTSEYERAAPRNDNGRGSDNRPSAPRTFAMPDPLARQRPLPPAQPQERKLS